MSIKDTKREMSSSLWSIIAKPNKALRPTAIPLRFMATGELEAVRRRNLYREEVAMSRLVMWNRMSLDGFFEGQLDESAATATAQTQRRTRCFGKRR